MALNKRTGLYAMPNHHLHVPKPTPRPTFNSMDFAGEDDEEGGFQKRKKKEERIERKVKVKEVNDNFDTQERKEKRRKNWKSLSKTRTPVTSTPKIEVTPATSSSKGKSEKKGEGKSNVISDKKRKRATDAGEVTAPVSRRASDGGRFVVGRDMLEHVRSSVKTAGEVFNGSKPAAQEEPLKKKRKKDKASRSSNDTVDFDRMAKETRLIAKKEKKARRTGGVGPSASVSVPITPLPAPSPPVFSSPLKKTPIPLPQNAFSHIVNASKPDRIGRRDSRLLVLETPPDLLPQTPVQLLDTPIPFKLTGAANDKKMKTEAKQAEETIHSPLPSSFTPAPPSSASSAPSTGRKLQLARDGRVSLTTSNLLRYTTTTQPLSDGPKPRPKSFSRAASTASTTTSAGTTPSIADVFARIGRKPYSRSGALTDPFTNTTTSAARSPRETHAEASAAAFTAAFLAAQRTVNFSDEAEYLAADTTWRQSNIQRETPLPCLGQKASGCNPKRERVLRLSKASGDEEARDSSSALKALAGKDTAAVAAAADTAVLADASHRSTTARQFLAHAIAARIPVPIGVLEGVWKLFCPAYAESHIDKYGYGQRSLSLFSVPASSSLCAAGERLFTARLSIPPRSMLFSLNAFAVPPHAGFRATKVRTSAEGYGLQVVWLGNGYLVLRVDLGLLLSGKEMGKGGKGKGKGNRVEGAGVMEFWGVHERATVWEVEEDELEKEGRRVFGSEAGK